MKRLIATAFVFLGACAFAASPAATQEWVRQYVATNRAPAFAFSVSTNTGYATSVITNEDGRVFRLSHAMRDRIALVVSNCTVEAGLLGVTNGTIFAHRGDGVFTNSAIGRAIVSIGTNCLNFAGRNSIVTNGIDAVDGFFDIRGTRIDRPTAERLNGDMRTAKIRPFDRAKRILANAANAILDVLIPSAQAETWGEYEAWVYNPLVNRDSLGKYSYTITDAKTDETYSVGTLEDGSIDIYSLNAALEALKLSTTSIVRDAVESIVPQIAIIEGDLLSLDNQLEDLSVKLSTSISGLSDRLEKLELEDEESGVSKTLKRSSSTDGSTTYTGHGIFNVAAAQADGKSIVSNASGKLSLKNFPTKIIDVGGIPYFSRELSLEWFYLKDCLDGKSLVADVNPSYPKSVYNSDDYHGIHLAGWHSPKEDPYRCDLTLAGCLTSTNYAPHYILTQIIDAGNGNSSMHYMSIGKLGALGGSGVLSIQGTEGLPVTIGSGTQTNFITFVSATNSNVKVNVKPDGDNGVKVTFGVYWMP